MYFVFDLETTGLPQRSTTKTIPVYKDLEKFKSARVVSMAWILLDKDFECVSEEHIMFKPNGFIIPPSATEIHGISHDDAMTNGIDPMHAWNILHELLEMHPCEVLVAHNIAFDKDVLLSELYRHGSDTTQSLLESFNSMRPYCTMLNGKKALNVTKFPKLAELYKQLCGKELVGAHNALYDTRHCKECFVALMQGLHPLAFK